jgi:hypothetical protein
MTIMNGIFYNSGTINSTNSFTVVGYLINDFGGSIQMTGWLDFIVPVGDTIIPLGHEDLVDNQGNIYIGDAFSNGALTIINGTINNFGNFTIINGTINSSGTINNHGTVINNGTFYNNGTINSTNSIKNYGQFINLGTLTSNSFALLGSLINYGTIITAGPQNFNISKLSDPVDDPVDSIFNNYGLFKNNATMYNHLGGTINNYGNFTPEI